MLEHDALRHSVSSFTAESCVLFGAVNTKITTEQVALNGRDREQQGKEVNVLKRQRWRGQSNSEEVNSSLDRLECQSDVQPRSALPQDCEQQVKGLRQDG